MENEEIPEKRLDREMQAILAKRMKEARERTPDPNYNPRAQMKPRPLVERIRALPGGMSLASKLTLITRPRMGKKK
jgi:hypothetical protein